MRAGFLCVSVLLLGGCLAELPPLYAGPPPLRQANPQPINWGANPALPKAEPGTTGASREVAVPDESVPEKLRYAMRRIFTRLQEVYEESGRWPPDIARTPGSPSCGPLAEMDEHALTLLQDRIGAALDPQYTYEVQVDRTGDRFVIRATTDPTCVRGPGMLELRGGAHDGDVFREPEFVWISPPTAPGYARR